MSDRLERLINLVIALREARVPMTAAEIRERVAGYGQDDQAAFRRMFERDKADLRALGIPLQTAFTDRWHDREGYRIDPDDYDLEPIQLEPDELAALAVALQITGIDDHLALRKLEAAAGALADEGGEAHAPMNVVLDEPHRDALLAAQLEGKRVRFGYRPPGRALEPRTVDPAGLVHRGGHWYLVGHDLDRAAHRAFRLDRISGDVMVVGEADPVGGTVTIEDVLPPADPVAAEVAASSEANWLVARRADGPGEPMADGRTRYTVSARDGEELLAWLLRLGSEVELLGPPALRVRITAALDAVVEATS